MTFYIEQCSYAKGLVCSFINHHRPKRKINTKLFFRFRPSLFLRNKKLLYLYPLNHKITLNMYGIFLSYRSQIWTSAICYLGFPHLRWVQIWLKPSANVQAKCQQFDRWVAFYYNKKIYFIISDKFLWRIILQLQPLNSNKNQIKTA